MDYLDIIHVANQLSQCYVMPDTIGQSTGTHLYSGYAAFLTYSK